MFFVHSLALAQIRHGQLWYGVEFTDTQTGEVRDGMQSFLCMQGEDSVHMIFFHEYWDNKNHQMILDYSQDVYQLKRVYSLGNSTLTSHSDSSQFIIEEVNDSLIYLKHQTDILTYRLGFQRPEVISHEALKTYFIGKDFELRTGKYKVDDSKIRVLDD